MLTISSSDYGKRHVTAIRPMHGAARGWLYDNDS